MPDRPPNEENPTHPIVRRVHGSRLVVRPGVPGADPTPQAADPVRAVEDTDVPWGAAGADSNDAQLKQDVPPHWS